MKKTIFMAILGFSIATIISGCGSSPQEYVEEQKEVMFLVDQNGNSVSGIEYDCVSGDGVSGNDGSILFYPGEECSLFLDFPTVDSTVDILHLEDTVGGLSGIRYSCENGDFGTTNDFGIFSFDNLFEDDECSFLL